MARQIRKKSGTGIYHIMLRGINRQDIFENAVHYTAKPNISRTWGVKPAALTASQILQADSTGYLLGGSLTMKNGKIDKYLFEGGYAQASAADFQP